MNSDTRQTTRLATASRAPARCTFRLLGSRVDILDLEDALAVVEGWIAARDGRCRQVVVSGFHGLWEAHRNPKLRPVFDAADLWVPDGVAPILVARLRGIRGARRIPGAELMEAFLARADFAGYRSFFYGDTTKTLARLSTALAQRYPGHAVAGALSPPFRPLSPEEDEEYVRAINRARPDVLWVGLGTPKQDRWIYEHRDRLEVPVAIAVGAAFRFLTGQIRRAPAWMGRMGLEWGYRLAMEPRKCWRRCVLQGPQFCLHVLLELAGLKR
jgi:N-acetylglucosaminyldiphosphoundecaprenol N-acetyl-beta-D-mannosaminyltransferase